MNGGAHPGRGHAAIHAVLADELRAYAGGALDVLEPLVERIRTQEPDPDRPEPDSCTGCPVCALITVLRGGRSELAVRLADQVTGLLAVLRTALDEGPDGPGGPDGADDTASAPAAEAPPRSEPGPPTASGRAGHPAAAAERVAGPVDGAPTAATAPRPQHGPRAHRGRRVQRIAVDHDDRWLMAAGQTDQC
jgi:hypothetical protein